MKLPKQTGKTRRANDARGAAIHAKAGGQGRHLHTYGPHGGACNVKGCDKKEI